MLRVTFTDGHEISGAKLTFAEDVLLLDGEPIATFEYVRRRIDLITPFDRSASTPRWRRTRDLDEPDNGKLLWGGEIAATDGGALLLTPAHGKLRAFPETLEFANRELRPKERSEQHWIAELDRIQNTWLINGGREVRWFTITVVGGESAGAATTGDGVVIESGWLTPVVPASEALPPAAASLICRACGTASPASLATASERPACPACGSENVVRRR